MARRTFRLALCALAAGALASASGPQPSRALCGTGPVRCFAALRLDRAVVRRAADPHPGLGARDLQSAYALAAAAATRGAGQTVAVVDAYDDPTIEPDLNAYRAYYGLGPCTTADGCFRKVNQEGEQRDYPVVKAAWRPEIALDTEMVSAVCPRCRILLVEARSADETNETGDPTKRSDLGEAVDTAVRLGATVVSNSYGSVGAEPYQPFWNHYYDHPGVAIVAAAGDVPGGTSWPASSPFVTAVGGTRLVRDPASARGWRESAWGGGGSGCSRWEARPAWQSDTACTRRSVADVSAVADDVAIYDTSTGGWGLMQGTSVAAPIVAGVYALAGNAKSVVYGSYPYAHRSGLNDVAGAGYDAQTGIGTPHGISAF